MIDLHTHTKYSDGTWTLEELLKNAQKNKVKILSITDHNTVEAHIELRNNNFSEIFLGKIISGVEINTSFNNTQIELLGYDFDLNKLDNWINAKLINNISYLEKEYATAIETCRKNNIKVDEIKYDNSMGWPIDIIFNSLKKYKENKKLFSDEEWNNSDYFFRCCTCNQDFPLYIDFSTQLPNAKTVSDVIRDAGGKVFVAHLFKYPLKDYIKFLDILKNENIIDGIEVYYSGFNKEQINLLENYCKKYNLLMSAGSDCHGEKRPEIKIGNDKIKVPEEVIEFWS